MEEKAIVKYIIDKKPRLKSESVKRSLKFQTTWDEIVKELSKPFALFYIVRKHNIVSLQNTSHSPDFFCSAQDKCCVDDERFSQYAKQIKRRAATQGSNLDVIDELKACSEPFELESKTGLRGINVSGEFILFLLAHRVAKLFDLDKSPNIQSLAYRLAQECDFGSLKWLQKGVLLYLKGEVR